MLILGDIILLFWIIKKRTPRIIHRTYYSAQKYLCCYAVIESNEKSTSVASIKCFDLSYARLDGLADSSANDSFFT